MYYIYTYTNIGVKRNGIYAASPSGWWSPLAVRPLFPACVAPFLLAPSTSLHSPLSSFFSSLAFLSLSLEYTRGRSFQLMKLPLPSLGRHGTPQQWSIWRNNASNTLSTTLPSPLLPCRAFFFARAFQEQGRPCSSCPHLDPHILMKTLGQLLIRAMGKHSMPIERKTKNTDSNHLIMLIEYNDT